MKTFKHKLVSCVAAFALVMGLTPAAAFAGTTTPVDPNGNPQQRTYTQDGPDAPQDASVGESLGSLDSNGQLKTDVSVKVTSNFKISSDDDSFSISSSDTTQTGKNVWTVTALNGVAIADGGSGHYSYQVERQVRNADGSLAGNPQTLISWTNTGSIDGNHSVDITYDFGAVGDAGHPQLSPGESFMYTMKVKDGSDVVRSINASVYCGSDYVDARITDAASTSKVWVSGSVFGDTDSGKALTNLNVAELPEGTVSVMRDKLDGYKIDGTYDVKIVSEGATNKGIPAYQSVSSIELPVNVNATDGSEFTLLYMAKKQSEGASQTTYEVEEIKVEGTNGVSLVADGNGRHILVDLSTVDKTKYPYLGTEPFAFAVAYKVPQAQKVKVTSEVAPDLEGNLGGTIDKLGVKEYAQGETVSYTFLPQAGYSLDEVTVKEGAGTPYSVDFTKAPNTSNCLVYTVPSGVSDVTITAKFKKDEIVETKTWTVGSSVENNGTDDATGTITLTPDGGTSGQSATVKEGSSVRADFIGNTSGTSTVVDQVWLTYGTDTTRHYVTPTNGSYTISSVTNNTTVHATFKYGYTPTYPDVAVSYQVVGGHGKFGDNSNTSVEYGKSLNVSVVPDAGYVVKSVYYTVDGAETKYPARFADPNYVIDSVTGKRITVFVEFMAQATNVSITVGNHGSVDVEYTDANGQVQTLTGITGVRNIQVLSTSGSIKVAPVPESTSYRLASINPAGTQSGNSYVIPLSSIGTSGVRVTFESIDVPPQSKTVNVSYAGAAAEGVVANQIINGSDSPISSTITVANNNDLKLRVTLKSGYENLTVTYKKSAADEAVTLTAADGVYTVPSADVVDGATVTISCVKSVTPPEVVPFEVNASVTYDGTGSLGGSGCTVSPASKQFNTQASVADTVYTMTAASDEYVLTQLSFTGAAGENMGSVAYPASNLIQKNGRTYTYTLTKAQLEGGVRHVVAMFKYTPAVKHTITVELLDKNGNTVAAADAPISIMLNGAALAGSTFEKAAAEKAELGFVLKNAADTTKYKLSYRTFATGTPGSGGFTELVNNSYTFWQTTGNTTFQLKYEADSTAPEIVSHTITVLNAGGGTVADSTGATVANGGTLTLANRGGAVLNFTPASGNKFSYVVIDPDTAGEIVLRASNASQPFTLGNLTGSTLTLAGITADHTVKVVFGNTEVIENQLAYNVSAGDGGTVSPTGEVFVNTKVDAAPTRIQITPSAGYRVKSVKLGGADVTSQLDGNALSGGFYTLPKTNSGSTNVVVEFEQLPVNFGVNVVVNGAGGSKVTPKGQFTVQSGQQQMIDFTPDEGYDVDSVYILDSNGGSMSITNDVINGTRGGVKYSYQFTVTGDVIFVASFKKLNNGETGGYDETKEETTVTVAATEGGTVEPAGDQQIRIDSWRDFTFAPNAAEGYKLTDITLGGKSVIGQLDDKGVLRITGQAAKNAATGGKVELKAVFTKVGTGGSGGSGGTTDPSDPTNPTDPTTGKIKVNITSGSGGTVDPEGDVQLAPGQRFELALIADAGKQADKMELTYRDSNGLTSTTTVSVEGQTGYVFPALPTNLVGISVTFKDSSQPSAPATEVRLVKSNVAGEGATDPAADVSQKVTTDAPQTFRFVPKSGYRVKSAVLSGYSADSLVQAGASEVTITFDMLGNTERTLQVEFEALPVQEKDPEANIVISALGGLVAPGTKLENCGDEIWNSDIQIEHARVYPSSVTLNKSSDTGRVLTFVIYPDEGYKLVDLAYKFADFKPASLRWWNSENFNNETAGMNDIKVSSLVPQSRVGAPLGLADGSSREAAQAGGCYIFQIKADDLIRHMNESAAGSNLMLKILGNIVELAEGEQPDVIPNTGEGGEAAQVEYVVSSGAGGWISPAGVQSYPAGTTVQYEVKATAPGKKPGNVKVMYADGTYDLLSVPASGYVDINVREGMTLVMATFVDDAASTLYTVSASSAGTGGSVSPAGTSQVAADKSQSFTFKYTDTKAYLASLTVNGQSVSVGRNATNFTLSPSEMKKYAESKPAGQSADIAIVATFAVGGTTDPDNPNADRTLFDITTQVNSVHKGTEFKNQDPTVHPNDKTGGTISPESRTLGTTDSQEFTFIPNDDYMLASVVVERTVNGSTVSEALSAAELQDFAYTVYGSQLQGNAKIIATFIPIYFQVTVGHTGSGTVVPEGNLLVAHGSTLKLAITPASGYKVGEYVKSGQIAPVKAAAANESGLEGQSVEEVDVASAAGRAAGRAANNEEFNVASDASLTVPFVLANNGGGDEPGPGPTPGGDDPNNPNNPGTNTPSTTETVTVKAYSGGHGTISPEGTFERIKGSTVTFTLAADSGYVPVSVTYKPEGGSESTVAVSGRTANVRVDANCEVVANFSLASAAVSNSPVARTLRTLQGLAATGDAQKLGILGLTALACAGLGVALLSNNRRRKKADEK